MSLVGGGDRERRGAASIERVELLDEATADAVREMVERSATHEGQSPIGEHKFLRLQEGERDTFGLLARCDGAVSGYANATQFPPIGGLPRRVAAELVVDVPFRGRGIGRQLLERLVTEARAGGAERFDLWAHHADPACSWLADALQMYVGRALWQFSVRLDSVPQQQRTEPRPEGVSIRTFVPGRDEDALVAVIRAAFPDHPENGSWTRDELDQRAEQAWFDPSALLVAERADGLLLGLHWMKLASGEDAGEVYMLGVTPDAQGQGLGRVLLLEGLEEMRRRGVGVAYLYVETDNDAAIRLYRQAGFRHEHLDTCYSLDLEPRAADSISPEEGPST